ncbi:MAG: hypothetical protein O3C21_18585 [Verrucomicrobia bacterium]|nr:hypothetical protein [Verrucomicrobiota bacterium]
MSEETYSFLCPSCSAHLSVPVSVAGVTGPCPYCASTITSPMPHEVPLEDMMAIEEAIANESAAAATRDQPVYPPLGTVAEAPPYSPLPPSDYSQSGFQEQPTGDIGVSTIDTERMPKGKAKKIKQKSRGGQQTDVRREEPKPRPVKVREGVASPASATQGGGMSLFTKACIGIAGVALVALAAVYGLPMITGGSKDDPQQGNAGDGSTALNPSATLNTAAMTPNTANSANTGNGNAFKIEPNRPAPPNVGTPAEVLPAPPVIPDAGTVAASPVPDSPSDSGTAAVGSTDTALPASMTTYTPAEDSILVKPRQALDAFLAARNWKERVKHVTGGQALADEMKTYYTQYPDGPLEAVSINWTLNDKDPSGTEIYVFTTSFDVEGNDGLIYLDFPTVVEGRNGNYTVNWHSFVEFKDRHLHQFVNKRAFDKPQKFHVIAVRSHYFDGDPELEAKLATGEFVCVRADSPNPDDGTTAFLNTKEKSCATMAANLLWEKAADGQFDTPLVELCWKKTAAGAPYVAITKVLGDKWRDTPK